MTETSFVRPQMFAPSMLMSTAIKPTGDGGCSTRYCDPSRPCSSAATAANKMLRFGAFAWPVNARSTVSIAATPDALSTAPL